MSRGQNPLIWMVAISLPSAGHALGLGEIHVDSALNEPLAAEIDIVGATPEELAGLTAKVASRDTFARFNVDRPSFLSTTTFKVAQDAHGRPVLAVRSQESFTEPLVNFVIDLHWHNGELVRQYTLLLDPANYQTVTRLAQAAPITASPTATVTVGGQSTAQSVAAAAPAAAESNAPVSQAPSGETTQSDTAPSTRKLTHVKVGAKATLRGVAWRVGARSDIDIKRTMLAIYRANPSAFEGNINIMHLGALLTIPAREVIEAIDKGEARREVHAQMAAWRATPKGGIPNRTPRPAVVAAPAPKPAEAPAATVPVAAAPAPATVSQAAAASPPVVTPTPAATPAPQSAAAAAEAEELTQRIKTLEQSLRDVQAQIEREHNNLLNMQAQARYAEQQAASSAAAPQAKPAEGQRSYWGWMLAAGAALAGLVGAIFLRGRKSPGRPSRASDTPIMPFGEAAREISAKLQPPAAPEPSRSSLEASVNVRKNPARPSEPRIELSQMQHEPSGAPNLEDTVDTVEVETPESLKAAQLAEDEATVKLREELALAWSIPAAEDYGRTDNEEHSLADAIAKSLADTAKLRALKAEEEAKAEEYSGEETIVTGTHTVIVDPSETAMLPAATVNLSAEALQRTELMPGIPDSHSAQTQPLEQLDPAHVEAAQAEPAPAPSASIDSKNLDYNLLDLDQTQQHVHMPSMLHENAVVKERRTNLVDVLKMAIEREPERRDLRMKLLETYYAAAATNRQAFLEAVGKITADGRNLKESDWERINQMGRQIASDSDMFEEGKTGGDDEDLADCA
jgi:FimV-like protein